MSDWTDEEIGELDQAMAGGIAAQIARRLHRPAGAVSGKASRLRREGCCRLAAWQSGTT